MRRNSQQQDIVISGSGSGLLSEEVAKAIQNAGYTVVGDPHIASYRHVYVPVKSKDSPTEIVAMVGKFVIHHNEATNEYFLNLRCSEESKLTPAEAKEYTTCSKNFLLSLPPASCANTAWRTRAIKTALNGAESHTTGSLLRLNPDKDLRDERGNLISKIVLAHGHGLSVFLPGGEQMQMPRNIRQEYYSVMPVIKILEGDTKEDAFDNRLALNLLMKDVGLKTSTKLTVYAMRYQAFKDKNREMAFLATTDARGKDGIIAVVGSEDLVGMIAALADRHNARKGYTKEKGVTSFIDNTVTKVQIDPASLDAAWEFVRLKNGIKIKMESGPEEENPISFSM